MYDLFDLLGRGAVIQNVLAILETSDGMPVIDGPPGSGKSWVAREVGRQWQEQAGGVALVATGDSARGHSELYPFGYALSRLPKGWRAGAPFLADAGRLLEVATQTRGAVTATVEHAVAAHAAHKHRGSAYLGESAQRVLHALEQQSMAGPILVIADNLHWWDEESLTLLWELQSAELRSWYPFLARMRVLAVETDPEYQPVVNPTARARLLASFEHGRARVERVPRALFTEVLKALGAPGSLHPGTADEIYTATGGHLALASSAASQMCSTGETPSMVDPDAFRRALLSQRIYAMGESSASAARLLNLAAVLGLSFRSADVLCAYGDSAEGRQLLRRCRDEEVIEADESSYRFAHDIFRQYFTPPARESISIRERLVDCLRSLQPSNYELRCANALAAEMQSEAGVLGVQAVLQADRNHGDRAHRLPDHVWNAVELAGLNEATELLRNAWTAVKAYEFAECQRSLERLPRGLGRPLFAEAEFILAACLMSTRSETNRALARDRLRQWTGYEDEEPELGVRMMRQLLYGLSMVRDKTEARALEQQLRMSLERRAAFDPDAVDEMYSLDRCSGSLDVPEVALIRTGEAARHFAPAHAEAVIRRPLEYYRALANYGAALIGNAKYGEATTVFSRLSRIVDDYPSGVFPRVDYVYTNQLLAAYRTGRVSAAQAVSRQQMIIERHGSRSDPFYLSNALAVYLALDGRSEESVSLFDDLKAVLGVRDQPEPSMSFLLATNMAGALMGCGRANEAAQEWASAESLLDSYAYTDEPFERRRHALMKPAFAQPFMPASEFDRYAVDRHPAEFGPLWDNYGRGFRLPAIEFWRDN